MIVKNSRVIRVENVDVFSLVSWCSRSVPCPYQTGAMMAAEGAWLAHGQPSITSSLMITTNAHASVYDICIYGF